jgi:hypothetical protein
MKENKKLSKEFLRIRGFFLVILIKKKVIKL